MIFVIAIAFGGSTYAWNFAASIALWVVFAVCLVGYVLQQYFSILTTDTIFPTYFLKSRSLVLLYTATAGAGAANVVPLY